MKKSASILFAIALISSQNILAFDLKDLIKQSSQSGDSTLGQIGDFISNMTASSDINLDDLAGTWNYSSPAVSFQSDNALQKIGGATAATALENKLAPYYKTAGVTNLVMTVAEDHSFSMKMRLATVNGVIEKDESGKLIFNFKALNKINLGKVEAMATKSGETLNLTFDVSRLISIVEKVAAISKDSTFQTLSTILSSYDGIFAGFKLKRQ